MSNREAMIKKLGSEKAYLEWMRSNAAKPHKRGGSHGPKSVEEAVKKIEVQAKEAGVSVEVYVKRALKK